MSWWCPFVSNHVTITLFKKHLKRLKNMKKNYWIRKIFYEVLGSFGFTITFDLFYAQVLSFGNLIMYQFTWHRAGIPLIQEICTSRLSCKKRTRLRDWSRKNLGLRSLTWHLRAELLQDDERNEASGQMDGTGSTTGPDLYISKWRVSQTSCFLLNKALLYD